MRALHPSVLTLDEMVTQTRALADLVERAGLALPVPTCGEWTMADLAIHLYEVQSFWLHIIEQRPAGPEEYAAPDTPDDPASALRATTGRLADALAQADLSDEAWSWSDDHTVGFTVRRQIHEALVHRVDGVLAVGDSLPAVAPQLAADGVDELVDVMITGIPEWGTFLPAAQFVRLHATDTDDAWTMSLGHISGTSTQTGVAYDGLPGADRIGDDIRPDLTIAGPALALLLWAWGRSSTSSLTLTGETELAAVLRETVAAATQ